ncbi:hypothetical protein GCM10027341_47750 [Spirosoma knui]
MPGLAQSILNFARGRRGNQVGDGECWTLAETALRNAGAQTSRDIMGSDNIVDDADYIWGDEVLATNVRPGDIIQFRNYRYDLSSDTSSSWQERPHHTAIVDSVGTGGVVTVLESNVNGSRRVQRNQLYLRDGNVGGQSVTVTGRFWVYRPRPRS